MGRPRKRRREETEDTLRMARVMGNPDNNALGSANGGSQDLDLATSFGNEPELGTNGLHISDISFQGDNVFPPGSEITQSDPNIGFPSLDLPDGLTSKLEYGFTDWDPSQDLGQPFSTFVDCNLQSPTPPRVLGDLDSNSHTVGHAGDRCTCLSTLYSTLAKFQSQPEPSFPYSMGALRSATALSRDIVACHKCSQTYNTAIQNSMLLGTLLQLLIMEYARLLKHIDERSEQSEKISFRLGDPSSPFDSRHTGLPDCPMGITLDLSGDEWRTLARKAVAQEVLGSSRSSFGLIGIVQKMKERQTSWHERFSKGQCSTFHGIDHQHTAKNPDHICVQVVYIENLRKSLEALGL